MPASLGEYFHKKSDVRSKFENRLAELLAYQNNLSQFGIKVPDRTPIFCAGCPNRGTL